MEAQRPVDHHLGGIVLDDAPCRRTDQENGCRFPQFEEGDNLQHSRPSFMYACSFYISHGHELRFFKALEAQGQQRVQGGAMGGVSLG